MITAILILVGLAVIFGLILGYASVKFKVEGDPLVDQIDNLLPQTQCGQCSYPGCKPYAEAIASGEAPINQCPPGGESTILALADLLDVEPMELDEEAGVELDMPNVAVIVEKDCIGCTLCIQACPVDAIVGAAKLMHTVIEDECTGCDLCLAPCPVDCIDMVPRKTTTANWKWQEPEAIETSLSANKYPIIPLIPVDKIEENISTNNANTDNTNTRTNDTHKNDKENHSDKAEKMSDAKATSGVSS